MLLESANVPIPSEFIMPFAGALVAMGRFNFWIVVVVGALGNLVGSLVSYAIGYYGGRPLAERYGRYVFVSHHDLDRGEHWFRKHGNVVAFFSRMIPVVRTFISLPAGISEVPLLKFSLYTFLGSFIWSALLAYAGLQLGSHWDTVGAYLKKFDFIVVAAVVIAVGWWVYRHFMQKKPGTHKVDTGQ